MIVVQEPATRWAGLGWLAVGFVVYVVYRRRVVARARSRETVRRPPALGPGARARVPAISCRSSLASRRRRWSRPRGWPPSAAPIVAVHVLEVPLELPLDRRAAGGGGASERSARRRAGARGGYGVRVVPRLVRARSAGAGDRREAARATPSSSSSARRAGRSAAAAPIFGAHGRLRAQARALPRDGGASSAEAGMKRVPRAVAVLALASSARRRAARA